MDHLRGHVLQDLAFCGCLCILSCLCLSAIQSTILCDSVPPEGLFLLLYWLAQLNVGSLSFKITILHIQLNNHHIQTRLLLMPTDVAKPKKKLILCITEQIQSDYFPSLKVRFAHDQIFSQRLTTKHLLRVNSMIFHHFLCLAARKYMRITSAIKKKNQQTVSTKTNSQLCQ